MGHYPTNQRPRPQAAFPRGASNPRMASIKRGRMSVPHVRPVADGRPRQLKPPRGGSTGLVFRLPAIVRARLVPLPHRSCWHLKMASKPAFPGPCPHRRRMRSCTGGAIS